MARKYVLAAACVAALLVLYCDGLTRTGLIGPDEPRYAAVGQAMAASGDWVTPRLWGPPWFEKPALLYWMTALGFRLGLNEDLAPRLPVALLSIGFVLFFAWRLRREFGDRAAGFASVMLATSALWLGFSHVAVFDLPLAATFGACMLLVLSERRTSLEMAAAGGLLGAALLSKGFVAGVLFLPALWRLRRDWKHMALIAAGALVVAGPWHALMIARNGQAFIDDFFWKQQFSRFTSPTLLHARPVWFYIPVLLAGFFPWTPLLAVLIWERSVFRDERIRFLLAWLVWGLLFFSASVNKLPGYVLPLFPALAALAGIGIALKRTPERWLFALCGGWIWLFPIAGRLLPEILRLGLSQVRFDVSPWWILPALGSAILVWWQESSGHRIRAMTTIAALVTVCAGGIVYEVYPVLDRTVSARQYWKAHSPSVTCSPDTDRGWHYSLDYYAQRELPLCK